MKYRKLLAILSAAGALAFGLLHAQQQDARPLASLLPPGALLYLEAKDFGSLLHQWDSSAEKQKWIASANFGVLSRSRLVQRLAEARDQFATIAGIPVAFNIVQQAAGTRSAFAFYDVANLKFVYLSNIDSTRLNGNELWRSRTKYQRREAAGVPFFVNADAATGRVVAVASYKGWLVVATAEERMAQTLALLAGVQNGALTGDPWFTEITRRVSNTGDLRLVYNLEMLAPTPQFRTYWLQQNNTELKQFKSGIADLFETENGFREDRLLLRQAALPDSAESPALDAVLRYAPQPASLYRAWSLPNREQLSQVITQVVLAEHNGVPNSGQVAPVVSTAVSDVGNASDFETRIDQPPFRRNQNTAMSELTNVIAGMQPRALLHVQATSALSDGVFVLPQSGTAIECARPDLGLLQRTLASVADPTQTGSLDELHVSMEGNVLLLHRLPMTRTNVNLPVARNSTYLAMFDKKYEWPNYKHLFGLLDHSSPTPEAGPIATGVPTFFSGNIASLGDTLSRLDRASIVARDQAEELHETLQYELSTP